MALDARRHFRVKLRMLRITIEAGRGDVNHARGWHRQPLGQSGFSASSAAENQSQHGRGVRASIRKAAYTSASV
jgi:hypothetical protein